MKLAVLNLATLVLINHDIETSVHKIMFDITKPEALLDAALADQSMAGAKAKLAALCGNTMVTLTQEGSGSTKTIWNKLELRKLAEASTNNGGVLRIDNTAEGTRLRFTAEIGIDGALLLNDSKKLVLDISGKPNNVTMEISALDHPGTAATLLTYEKKSLDADVEKLIDTSNTSMLLLPIDETDTVEIFYNNGRTCKYTQEELKQQMFDTEDPVCLYNGNVFLGYVNNAVLSVAYAYQVKVTPTVDTTILAIKEQYA